MVAYGLFTSRREQNRQRYRSDKFYRGTFTIVVIVIVAQVFVVAAASAILIAEKRIDPATRAIELRMTRLASEEEQYGPLLRKLGILNSLKTLIVNRTPAARLINGIEEAFFANERVGLIELKLSNHFDPNDPNSKDDFNILITGAIKADSLNPTAVLTDFTKTLEGKLPKGANVVIARNASLQGLETFAPFDLRIHYSGQ
ncbi:MAG TPA: hypothetical protein VNV63_03285 [Nitrospiria bacterium]|nr:hypothetical protein [Nitrospiria bacterium]